MQYRDYYKILGVTRSATEKEIKQAYRQLARKYHPDVNHGNKAAEQKLKQINEAYEVLGDKDKKAKYERLGASWYQHQERGGDPRGFDWSQWSGRRQQGAGGPDVGDLSSLFGDGTGFSDFFNSMFSSAAGGPGTGQEARRRSVRENAKNIIREVTITLKEAALGTTRLLKKDSRTLEVKIPKGAKTGTRVRIAGEGTHGMDGKRGDLYLRVKVKQDKLFRRRGDDLQIKIPIDLYMAVLGGQASVPTPKGSLALNIPPESQNGQKFRLRGQGMPKLKNPRQHGDLYVQIQIQVPTNLSSEEISLFNELDKLRRS